MINNAATKPNTRGGPVDGQRSVSGRACLPLLIALVGITAGVGAVIMAVIA